MYAIIQLAQITEDGDHMKCPTWCTISLRLSVGSHTVSE